MRRYITISVSFNITDISVTLAALLPIQVSDGSIRKAIEEVIR